MKELLTKLGKDALPFIFINDELKITGRYPKAEELFALLGIDDKTVRSPMFAVQKDAANEEANRKRSSISSFLPEKAAWAKPPCPVWLLWGWPVKEDLSVDQHRSGLQPG